MEPYLEPAVYRNKKKKKKTKQKKKQKKRRGIERKKDEETTRRPHDSNFRVYVFLVHLCINKSREFRREEAFQARCPDFRETMDLGTFPNVCPRIH